MSVKRKFLLTSILILLLTVLPSCMKSNEDLVLTDTDSTYSDTTNEAEDYFLGDETQTSEETSAETQTTTQTETTAEKTTVKTTTQTTTKTETTTEKATVKATTAKRETTTEKTTVKTTSVKATQSSGASYILNTNTKKFHYPNCASVNRMSESNKKSFYGTRDEIIVQGYVPCKNCNP